MGKRVEEGMAEGRAKGLAEGRAEGRAEGLKEGLEKKAEAIREIARNLVSKGMPLKEIAEVTGLSHEELKRLDWFDGTVESSVEITIWLSLFYKKSIAQNSAIDFL